MDGNVIIELSNCTIGYKKIINSKEVDIDSSYEIVKDGILSVNKNIMTNKFPNVTYVCDVAYKGTSIRLYVSFSLAEQGVGIQNITTYYLASSKSKDIRVDSEGWTTSIQTINANNKYLWTYSVTNYTDGSSKTSEPLIMGTYGDDAITLYIESSNGNTFKNSDIATILTVDIYVGAERIESAEQLEKRFGKNAYLQWHVKKFGEKEFSPIDIEDTRINDIIKKSNKIVIPTLTSIVDVQATLATLKDVIEINKNIIIVVNRTKNNNKSIELKEYLLEEIEKLYGKVNIPIIFVRDSSVLEDSLFDCEYVEIKAGNNRFKRHIYRNAIEDMIDLRKTLEN